MSPGAAEAPRENNPGGILLLGMNWKPRLQVSGGIRGRPLQLNSGLQRGHPCLAARRLRFPPGRGNGRCNGRLVVFEPPLTASPNACTAAASIRVPLKEAGTRFVKACTVLRLTATPPNLPATGARRTADTD